MNLFIYSDESGVFDNTHESIYVYGGIILNDKEEKGIAERKFIAIENQLRRQNNYTQTELKANLLKPKDKRLLFYSVKSFLKFGIVIRLNKVHRKIFGDKKTKQRFLDYAYKLGVKRTLAHLESKNIFLLSDIENIHFFCDEHTTATNGKYELREAIEQELKRGTFNDNYQCFYPPIIPQVKSITLEYRNSETTTLIRAADIIANRIYFHSKQNTLSTVSDDIIIHLIP